MQGVHVLQSQENVHSSHCRKWEMGALDGRFTLIKTQTEFQNTDKETLLGSKEENLEKI